MDFIELKKKACTEDSVCHVKIYLKKRYRQVEFGLWCKIWK